MAFLNSVMSLISAVAPTILAPSKPWHLLILNVFSFVADYGWRIVVFTVLLKLLLSPLDYFQRYKMRKNQKITERLKPTMEKLQKQYANDKQAFSRAQMELNRKEGYSYFSSCLPMIVTMVVFITLWQSMNTIASYMTFKQYVSLHDAYSAVETALSSDDAEANDELTVKVGQEVVARLYYDGIDREWVDGDEANNVEGLRQKYNLPDSFTDKFFEALDTEPAFDYSKPQQAKFLWISNIWAPDVPWGDQAILAWSKFDSTVKANKYNTSDKSGLSDADLGIYNETTYNKVMGQLLSEENPHSKTNGYLVLPILVLLLSVGSQLISTMQQKSAGQVNEKGGAATSMKVMMFMMPALMLFFSLQYASIFTLYMTVNSAMSLLLNVLFTNIIKLSERIKSKRHYGIAVGSTRGMTSSSDSPIIHYVKGANPNAGAKPPKEILSKNATAAKPVKAEKPRNVVKGSGRPDPNELMGIDMSDRTKKK